MSTQRPLHTLKVISYILAGLVLILGLVASLSLLAGAGNVQNVLLPLHLMGAEAIANMVAPMLAGLARGFGTVTLILSLVISLLLFTAGRLLGHNASLEARLARLEAQLTVSEVTS
jgi:hypothetical protein